LKKILFVLILIALGLAYFLVREKINLPGKAQPVKPVRIVSKPKGPKIAIVIDDIGPENKKINEFLDLKVPLNFSIFPKERFSKEIAEMLESKKIPYLMHLPMEPEGYPKINPGKAALLVKMNKSEIKKMFLANLKTVGHPVGVNNHMGSRFTARRWQMYVILSELKDKNLFFFDSHTSTHTVGHFVARKIKEPCLTNDLFLDVTDDEEYMKNQFRFLIKLAKKNGYAIAICHIHKKNIIPAFKAMEPEFDEEGVQFVYLQDLLNVKKIPMKKRNKAGA